MGNAQLTWEVLTDFIPQLGTSVSGVAVAQLETQPGRVQAPRPSRKLAGYDCSSTTESSSTLPELPLKLNFT